MNYLQKLGKAIMLPVACLPLCGILMGAGYFLCPASMLGGTVAGMQATIGMFLVRAGGALIDHIALLFAVGIGIGMSDDRDGTSGIAALVSWLTITSLLNADFMQKILPESIMTANALHAFSKIENPFIGIMSGLIGAAVYDRFRNTQLPAWLAFFSGKRSGVILSGLVSIVAAAILIIVWPVLFGALTALGFSIAEMGALGAGIYAFLNRLLIPFGLHHALNNVFWFDSIGLGDITHFWAGDTSADVGWSLGIYMSGFFPCMMFGVPGAALAMIHAADRSSRRNAAGILGSAAICSFVSGISEPFEFAFMFLSPPLYLVYSLLYGVFTWITALSPFRAGFAFSAGVTDLIFSLSLPAAQGTWLILPLGLAAFAVFFGVFAVLIRAWDVKTPGRDAGIAGKAEAVSDTDAPDSVGAAAIAGVNIGMILNGLGGRWNILSLDNCITRLRVEVRDMSLVDEAVLVRAGAKGVVRMGKHGVQTVIGLKVQQVADALHGALELPPVIIRCASGEVFRPVRGRVIPREEIPDQTFAEGVMGDGVGIVPEEDVVAAPFDGKITSIADSLHAIGISGYAAEGGGSRAAMEVLVHVGIDTVNMQGDGFTCLVSEGELVKAGQPLLRFDREKIREAGYSDIVAVLLVNSEDLENVECICPE